MDRRDLVEAANNLREAGEALASLAQLHMMTMPGQVPDHTRVASELRKAANAIGGAGAALFNAANGR